MKVKLQPPSATDLPAFNPILPPAAITQVMLLANPNKVCFLHFSTAILIKYIGTSVKGHLPITTSFWIPKSEVLLYTCIKLSTVVAPPKQPVLWFFKCDFCIEIAWRLGWRWFLDRKCGHVYYIDQNFYLFTPLFFYFARDYCCLWLSNLLNFFFVCHVLACRKVMFLWSMTCIRCS